ncbi:glycerophosphodiester phosphodiesterase [Janthinobacterium agaricidamnosum]|uniref:Glycerophosphoryl diester phosphodiesterase n=1 Tax=Janthinobacterium agaricidamnosum NBRC 102515 = DSM 9628 TaxID=1349767 RepID=W0VBQ4_9BURK|nr:glycerophosphodiester phosphodiesterase [Janthinobacterium agaricidamnosum]CDG84793.1 glycerophosphoryl diester phosphodiesterase [Janthinobacterium agaricidamnosum NBRC 102515 = DSM 9628]
MWPYPKIVAHRGGGTLAPENTLAGLRCGLAYGYRAVEFDVMLARDGVPVVVHDTQLGRTVRGNGDVNDYTAAELAKMDAGSWFGPQFAGEPVASFEQFIVYCQEQRIWMNIEIKPAPGCEEATGTAVALLVRAHFAETIASGDPARLPLLSSFSVTALRAAKLAAPDLPRGLLVERIPADWLAQATALDAVALHCNHQTLTKELAAQVKQAGLGLFCYTVNDAERARAIVAWGVDGYCTDRIDMIAPA